MNEGSVPEIDSTRTAADQPENFPIPATADEQSPTATNATTRTPRVRRLMLSPLLTKLEVGRHEDREPHSQLARNRLDRAFPRVTESALLRTSRDANRP